MVLGIYWMLPCVQEADPRRPESSQEHSNCFKLGIPSSGLKPRLMSGGCASPPLSHASINLGRRLLPVAWLKGFSAKLEGEYGTAAKPEWERLGETRRPDDASVSDSAIDPSGCAAADVDILPGISAGRRTSDI